VSFAEVRQRLTVKNADDPAWSGFAGVGDPVLEPLPTASLEKLRGIRRDTAQERAEFVEWVRESIAPRNIGGFGEPSRQDRYPVDLDWLINRHALLSMTRDEVVAGLPALRGMSAEPSFA
jgi:hypothetical protein